MPDGSDRRVTIPAGIVDGESLRVRGAGLPGQDGGPSGDLIVEVSVAERGPFRRDGDDIVVDAPIGFVTAALGGTVRVRTPRGRTVTLKVPAGSSDGRRLRIPGGGIAGAGGAGDLHARLHVVVPEGLDDETAATLEALRDRLDP
jgi:molecular chaperone DnaJ